MHAHDCTELSLYVAVAGLDDDPNHLFKKFSSKFLEKTNDDEYTMDDMFVDRCVAFEPGLVATLPSLNAALTVRALLRCPTVVLGASRQKGNKRTGIGTDLFAVRKALAL